MPQIGRYLMPNMKRAAWGFMQSGDFPVPVCHLKFGENTGVVAYDSSPEGNDGDIDGASWVNGYLGSGLSFDGLDDKVTVADASELRPGDDSITIIGSVKLDLSEHVYIWNKYGTNGYTFRADSTGRLRFIYRLDTTDYYTLSDAGIVSADIWQRVGVILDRTDDEIKFYVAGILKSTVDFDPTGTLSFTGAVTLLRSSWFNEYNPGVLDEILFYNEALTNAQMRQDALGYK